MGTRSAPKRCGQSQPGGRSCSSPAARRSPLRPCRAAHDSDAGVRRVCLCTPCALSQGTAREPPGRCYCRAVTGHEASRLATHAPGEARAGANGWDGVWFGGRARTLPVETHVDDRGWLAALDFDMVQFDVARAFVVGSGHGISRGGHGHRRGRQLLTLVAGRVRIDMRWREDSGSVELSSDCRFVLLEPGVWASQTYLDQDSCLVVFCDTPYDPGDYVRDAGDVG